ncbi:MAG TPA: TonB-dependent receptor, partial [Prevotella sp.]
AITIGANMNAQGQLFWDEANSYSQDFYAVMGAHVKADLGFLSIDLWGRNLTNSRYNTFAVSSAATGKLHYFGQLGNPFQCGVDVRLHF